MNNPTCSSCRRGERSEPATVAVTGLLNGRPYRANLCNDHLTDLEINLGLRVRSCRKVSTSPNAHQLGERYRKLCATVILDAAGITKLDAAREQWFVALVAA